MPLFLMIITFSVEIGFVMYDFSTINYTASSMAVEAARKGVFDDEVAGRGGDYLRDFTSRGKDGEILRGGSFHIDPANIVIWGPSASTVFQRGDLITVGITYPLEFKLFFMNSVAHWVIDDQKLNLKARASALSEVYFEP